MPEEKQDKNRDLAKSIVDRYRTYASFVNRYATETNLHLDEKQLSLLEKAVYDDLTGNMGIPIQSNQTNTFLDERIDIEYMETSPNARVFTLMLNALKNSDNSPFQDHRKQTLTNSDMLKVYRMDREDLKKIRNFGHKCYKVLGDYLMHKRII